MLAFVVALVYSYKGTWQSFDSKDGKYNDLEEATLKMEEK